MIRWLVSILEWYIPALAWEKRLGELVQHHVAIAVAAEREQMGATITRHVTQAMRLGRAPSSRSASKLTAEELQMLMIYLKCLVIPVEKEKSLADLQELGCEYEWGQSSEPSRTDSFIAHFKLHLELPCGVDLIAANTGSAATGMRTPVQGVYGLEFRVKLKNDALFVPTNADGYRGKDFALIGLETKKALSKANMEQKLAQFLAWALRSNSAYIQVLSDLRSGGVAWWLSYEDVVPGKHVICEQYFVGMPALYAFLERALAAVPWSMLGYDRRGRIIPRPAALCSEELLEPRRLETYPADWQAASWQVYLFACKE